MKEIIKTIIDIGIEKPFKILHITDGHLTFTNEKDSIEHVELEKKRTLVFQKEGNYQGISPCEFLKESLELGEKMGALTVCTGDMIDIQTFGNIEKFKEILGNHDIMFTPGGHEHQKRCVRTMEEPYGYWKKSRERLRKIFPQYDLDFDSRIVNGVNIITADNSLDYFNEMTLSRFKKELERGLPMIVFSHDPIRDKYLQATSKTHENVELSEKDYKISHEMIDLIENHPLVKAFVAGHNHDNEQGLLHSGNSFYVTPGLFAGVCRLIEVI